MIVLSTRRQSGKTIAISSRIKGNGLIILGILLLVWVLYNLISPWSAAVYNTRPVRDAVLDEEFIVKPRLDEVQVEKTKDLLKTILGYNSDRKFNILIFPQDYLEMRPTGGFPGTYLFARADQGDLETVVFDDIWNFDKPLERAKQPQLNQYAWLANFPSAAQYAMDVYRRNTRQDVDGVMTLDPTSVKYLLAALGPVEIPAYNLTIDQDNITDKILEYSPYVKDAKGPAKHKAFMGEIVKAIKDRLSDYDTLAKRDAIAAAFLKGLESKHILIFFNDKSIKKVVSANQWDGAIDNSDAIDFLAVRDYNGGINKVDLYIDRDMDYVVDLDGAYGPAAKLKIEYRYAYDKKLFRKYGSLAAKESSQYKDILRIYTPKGAELMDSAGYSGDVKSRTEDGRRVFEGLVALDPNTSKTVTLEYSLPIDVKKNYSLLLSKQPGLPIFAKKAPSVKVVVRSQGRTIETYYPDYRKYTNSSIEFRTDLEYDRFLKLRFKP